MKDKLYLCILLITLVASGLFAQAYGKIIDFKAEDVPFDDGSGIVLSWKPLPKEYRIIEYRIYRGVSPDTLFFFGQIEVDPNTSIVSERMYYYDKDYPLMLTLDHPRRLKKEKQQTPSSPLYQGVPRDPVILKALFPYYSILGVVNNTEFYFKSKKTKKEDGSFYAGLNITQFEQLAANPLPGKTYYYTVLAVNEKGKYLPYADITKATPIDNFPDNSSNIYSVFVSDRRFFNLEWIPTQQSLDIAEWHFYLIPNSLIPNVKAWQTSEKTPLWLSNTYYLGYKSNDGQNFYIVNLKDGKPILPDNSYGKTLPLDKLQDYTILLEAKDYNGWSAYSIGNPLRILNSDKLPKTAKFSISDKPNDKGDVAVLSFGKPLANISQVFFTNSTKSKLRLTYELSEHPTLIIRNIIFKIFSTDGKELATITEYFPDKVVTLKLSKPMPDLKEFLVKTAYRFDKQKHFSDFYVSQTVKYDPQTKRYLGKDINYNGEILNQYSYQIMRKNRLESTYLPTKKFSAISRSFDDIISFESTLQKVVQDIDIKTGRILLDPKITFATDTKTGLPLQVFIYKEEQENYVMKIKEEIEKLKKTLSAKPQNVDSLKSVLREKQSLLNALIGHPIYKRSLSIKSPHRWLKQYLNEMYQNSRSYSYQIFKTDGEAGFSLSEPGKYFIPLASWFDWTKFYALIASLVFCFMVIYASTAARRGKDLYIRPIAGLIEIDNAVGRATEMGRPILYVMGLSSLGEISTIASLMILNRIAVKSAQYDTRLLVPCYDYLVMPLAQEMVRESYYEANRADAYNQNDIFFVANDQFPYVAGVNGTMIREKCSCCFYMGYFAAEALLMTETGNATGSIQIAGTDAITQVPFFITTCDYTLIGEEFYAASAYLSKDPELVGMLKAQDYFKFVMVFFIVIGSILATLHFNWLTNSFPIE